MINRLTILLLCCTTCLLCGCTARGWPRPQDHIYQHAAVACDHPLASQAGLEMLQQGGNAVDAAVAASFTLSVVRPYSCGLGGGGFMLIATPDDDGALNTVAINYRETAPAAVGPKYYVNLDQPQAGRFGVHAVGVPGTVAGLLHALETYGTLDRAAVLAPAIRIAEQGFEADAHFILNIQKVFAYLDKHPHIQPLVESVLGMYTLEGNLVVGDVIRNPRQAEALRLIAQHGEVAFYDGEIGEAIARVMREQGGPITADDLRNYRLRTMPPLTGSFGGFDVIAMPPPSSGGITLLQILSILERRWADLAPLYHNSPPYIHLVTEAMKHAFADRAAWLADPAFVDVPTRRLLDPTYLDQLALRISMTRTSSNPLAYGSVDETDLLEDGGTSHISVIDANGMAVACTETINTEFGSMVLVPEYGFFLNNEMDDFTTIPGTVNAYGLRQSDRNLPEPGKRPLSSMSPTILTREGRVVLVIGGSGGPRIISGTLQCILNCMLFELPPADAVQRARFHHQWLPDELFFEQRWPSWSTRSEMRSYGHQLNARRDIGVIQMIRITQRGIEAASDPRKGGEPAGY
jgi:gamma-glutamyltranspeptidase/glutathione hydrolase